MIHDKKEKNRNSVQFFDKKEAFS